MRQNQKLTPLKQNCHPPYQTLCLPQLSLMHPLTRICKNANLGWELASGTEKIVILEA